MFVSECAADPQTRGRAHLDPLSQPRAAPTATVAPLASRFRADPSARPPPVPCSRPQPRIDSQDNSVADMTIVCSELPKNFAICTIRAIFAPALRPRFDLGVPNYKEFATSRFQNASCVNIYHVVSSETVGRSECRVGTPPGLPGPLPTFSAERVRTRNNRPSRALPIETLKGV
jgi:hypothetical protein